MTPAIVERMTHCRNVGNDRIDAFRDRLRATPGFNRIAHDADIARGVIWKRNWFRRPGPKHKALTIIGTAPGGIPAEDYAHEQCACADYWAENGEGMEDAG